MHDAFAPSLAARLRLNPLVADCVALSRLRAGVASQVAFVVPTREVAPDERWLEAEEHTLESGLSCSVVLVDRLPLRADGTVDEESLLALPVHDDAAIEKMER